MENSPSKVAAADQPFNHFISAEAVTRAASWACAAPLTNSWRGVWNVAPMARSGLKFRVHAARPRSVRIDLLRGVLLGAR